jgi:hypothetical protein
MALIRPRTASYLHSGAIATGAVGTVFPILLYLFGGSSGFFSAIDLTELVPFLIVGPSLVGIGAAQLLRIPTGT